MLLLLIIINLLKELVVYKIEDQELLINILLLNMDLLLLKVIMNIKLNNIQEKEKIQDNLVKIIGKLLMKEIHNKNGLKIQEINKDKLMVILVINNNHMHYVLLMIIKNKLNIKQLNGLKQLKMVKYMVKVILLL